MARAAFYQSSCAPSSTLPRRGSGRAWPHNEIWPISSYSIFWNEQFQSHVLTLSGGNSHPSRHGDSIRRSPMALGTGDATIRNLGFEGVLFRELAVDACGQNFDPQSADVWEHLIKCQGN